MRRMITGANTRGYGIFFVEVLKTAHAARESGQNVARSIINALGTASQGMVWPTDADVTAAFANNKFYNAFTQERIRMILGAIDKQLQIENPRTEPAEFVYEKLQIEHILPQSWQKNWALDNADAAQHELAVQQRQLAVHRLGNLTLVTPQFNQKVSNASWDEKQPEFALQSSLQLNRSVAASEQWDEQTIQARSKHLAATACRVWERPASGQDAG